MLKNYTPHTLKVSLSIVGYTNLSLLGKRQTLKVYKTKASCKIAAAKIIVKAKIKAAKDFVNDFAAVLKGEALKAKVWTAKRMLRLKGYSWELYINVCNAYRLLRLFNNSVCFDLRVKL
jgi:ABC-type uncharacterized transport system permease subunit